MEEEIVSDEAVGADFEETMEFVERSQIDAVAPQSVQRMVFITVFLKLILNSLRNLEKKNSSRNSRRFWIICRNIYPSYRTWRKKGKHFYISEECVP